MVTKLVILVVIVLGVIALAQIMRVYELSSKLSKKNEAEISNRDNKMNATLMLGFMIFLFVGYIWLMLKYGWTGRGDAASEHGVELDELLNLNFFIISIVFFLTNLLLFGFAFKYVKKPGVPAFYYPHNNKLEMVWTVIPAMVLAVIIILGLRSWNEATDKAKDDSIRVELFSEQYSWTARYSGEDNKLGNYDYKLTTPSNPLALKTSQTIQDAIDFFIENDRNTGLSTMEEQLNDPNLMMAPEERALMLDRLKRHEKLIRLTYQMQARHNDSTDATALDDFIQKDTMYLCVNKEYEFNFRSKDVIHSAYFPHFRAQMNTVPGHTTRFKFKPIFTSKEMKAKQKDENFEYILMCNKICGKSHYGMKMFVVVLDEKAYEAWETNKKENATFGHKYNGGSKETPTENEEEVEKEVEIEENEDENVPA